MIYDADALSVRPLKGAFKVSAHRLSELAKVEQIARVA